MTPTEFILSWALSKNIIMIPRTTSVQHLQENLQTRINIVNAEDYVFIERLK